jgi:hypothetical protein
LAEVFAPDHGTPRRREELLSEPVDHEVSVLDQGSGHAHCLTGVAASIWAWCDSVNDAARLAELTGDSVESVAAAIVELSELGLLEPDGGESRGLTRRAAAQRAIQAGAGALVLSAALPTVASAASKIANGKTALNCKAALHATAADTECASGTCYHATAGLICAPTGCVVLNGVCVITACCSGACGGNLRCAA